MIFVWRGGVIFLCKEVALLSRSLTRVPDYFVERLRNCFVKVARFFCGEVCDFFWRLPF